MQVGVGYSDTPDTAAAGAQAVKMAMEKAGRYEPCDLALLFCTVQHNQAQLREAVAAELGEEVPIYGGGTVGVITNDYFGYAGDQAGVACIWLDGARYEALAERDLADGEEAVGQRIGKWLAEKNTRQDSPVMLFYDAVNYKNGDIRLIMATWLLLGIEKGLGFLPDLTGAGLQGDHACTPSGQFIGNGIGERHAIALTFSDDIQIDSTIMHGCRPASEYFTVTKSDGPVILEINGEPAIPFLDKILHASMKPEEYPFFLMFGINQGEKWGEYDENNYASRLCFGIDMERQGVIMFEPDMVPGTRFQLMFRSLDLDYMPPKIEAMFDNIEGREPLFALYIDCAGRCAGYGGLDMEDAVVLQKTVAGRVPLLGLYTGVEIASIGGRPRGLDWTGVFCLFTRRKEDAKPSPAREQAKTWESAMANADADHPTVEAVLDLCERNAAKVLKLDRQMIAIRYELEQKRRGFRLLSELAVTMRQTDDYVGTFISVAQRINSALNMQKTVIMVPDGSGEFTVSVSHGYSTDEKILLFTQQIHLTEELLGEAEPVVVTAADADLRCHGLREALNLPYFISSPVVVQEKVVAVLVTGRMVEQPPFLSRLSRSDMETVQAISELLASVLVRQRLDAAEERAYTMLNATPLCANFWDTEFNNIDCNMEAAKLFGLSGKQEYLERFDELSPEFQPNGEKSTVLAERHVRKAFGEGYHKFEWMHKKLGGELIPAEITLVRVKHKERYIVAGYTRDLREQKAIDQRMREADERYKLMLDATPLGIIFWDKDMKAVDCNRAATRLFGFSSKQEYLNRFAEISPEFQPDGRVSSEASMEHVRKAFEEGMYVFEWMHQKPDGEPIPCEITLVRVQQKGQPQVVGFTRDLRELKAAQSAVR